MGNIIIKCVNEMLLDMIKIIISNLYLYIIISSNITCISVCSQDSLVLMRSSL